MGALLVYCLPLQEGASIMHDADDSQSSDVSQSPYVHVKAVQELPYEHKDVFDDVRGMPPRRENCICQTILLETGTQPFLKPKFRAIVSLVAKLAEVKRRLDELLAHSGPFEGTHRAEVPRPSLPSASSPLAFPSLGSSATTASAPPQKPRDPSHKK